MANFRVFAEFPENPGFSRIFGRFFFLGPVIFRCGIGATIGAPPRIAPTGYPRYYRGDSHRTPTGLPPGSHRAKWHQKKASFPSTVAQVLGFSGRFLARWEQNFCKTIETPSLFQWRRAPSADKRETGFWCLRVGALAALSRSR